MDDITRHLASLTFYFYEKVKVLPNVNVYGHFDKNIPRVPIVSLNIGDLDSSVVANILSEDYGVNIRSGGHCAPKMHLALGTQKQGLIRFSFSIYTKYKDLDVAVSEIKSITSKKCFT